jgi:hypothetical protein
MLFLWIAMLCELVGRYQRFEGTYYLHLGDATHGINIGIFTAVRISNLTKMLRSNETRI